MSGAGHRNVCPHKPRFSLPALHSKEQSSKWCYSHRQQSLLQRKNHKLKGKKILIIVWEMTKFCEGSFTSQNFTFVCTASSFSWESSFLTINQGVMAFGGHRRMQVFCSQSVDRRPVFSMVYYTYKLILFLSCSLMYYILFDIFISSLKIRP